MTIRRTRIKNTTQEKHKQPSKQSNVPVRYHTVVKERPERTSVADDWTLTGDQFLYLARNNNMIVSTLAADNFDAIRELAASEEFISRFGTMGFDEAYDRYLTAIEEGRA